MTTSHPLSVAFAAELQEFLNAALVPDTHVDVIETDDSIRVVPHDSLAMGKRFFAVADTHAHQLLRVEYKLADDPSGRFFRVLSSTFGLYVSVTKGVPVPLVRVEYERSQTPSAHVHFHTSSALLGWDYGRAGEPFRREQSLHFPVGGARFRPTIEEFLLFLDRERLVDTWGTSDWKARAVTRQADYEVRQARGVARRHPRTTAEELRSIGWTVVEPPGAS